MAKIVIKAPWEPIEFGKLEAASIQAVATGTASERQQKRAMQWIVHNLCEINGLSYRPNNDSDTTFAEGKRFVGLQLSKIINTNIDTLKE
jgi:hypothetical protein